MQSFIFTKWTIHYFFCSPKHTRVQLYSMLGYSLLQCSRWSSNYGPDSDAVTLLAAFVSRKWSRCLQCTTTRRAASALSERQDELFNIIRSQRTFLEAKSIVLICFTLPEAINSCSLYSPFKLSQKKKKTKEFCMQKWPCFSSQNQKSFFCTMLLWKAPRRDLSRVPAGTAGAEVVAVSPSGLVSHGAPERLPAPATHPAHSRSTGRPGGAGTFRKQAWRKSKQHALQAGQIFKHCPWTQPKKIKNPTGYSPKSNTQNPLSTALNMHSGNTKHIVPHQHKYLNLYFKYQINYPSHF